MSVGAVNKNTGERIPTAGMPAIDNALSATSTNPVQNAIITAALALKQNATDNSLQTTDKTVVGAINEHEGDIGSLKSGLTNKADYHKYIVSANTSSYTISDLSDIFMSILAVSIPPGYSDAVNGLYVLCRQGNTLLLTPLHETTPSLGLTATLTDGNIVLAWTVTNNYGGSIALIDLYKNQ